MAESKSFRQSLYLGSDNVPEHYCDPCSEVHDTIKPVAGYCQNCNEDLCLECYTGHLRRKQFQDHKLVDKSTRPKTKQARQTKPKKTGVECHLHPGETIQSFCQGHSQNCCNICLTITHLACKTEKISKLATNIQDSQELQRITNKLNTLKNGFKDTLSKTGANESVIQKNHSKAINEMQKLREEFDKLMIETESKADKVKEEDFNKIEKVAGTCDIVIQQINKLTTNLETLKEKGETECLFVSMKHAEGQLMPLEENLEKLDKENTVREYQFEPDARLKDLLEELKELGQLLFESAQQKKRPTHLKDIIVKSSSDYDFTINGSLVLPNKRMLITDSENSKIKLIDTNQDKIISEIKLSGQPIGITKVKDQEFAFTLSNPNKIQFVTLSQNTLSKGRNVSVNGECNGLAYNDKDQTLIVAYSSPPRVEILNMAGTIIKCLNLTLGNNLFDNPHHVALSPSMTEMFVTEADMDLVINLTMNGDINAVDKDKSILGPEGICVHTSGLVYAVGQYSHSVHMLDPNSGKFKQLLGQKDGLEYPRSISYCEFEDKLYIGMQGSSSLKVFQMK